MSLASGGRRTHTFVGPGSGDAKSNKAWLGTCAGNIRCKLKWADTDTLCESCGVAAHAGCLQAESLCHKCALAQQKNLQKAESPQKKRKQQNQQNKQNKQKKQGSEKTAEAAEAKKAKEAKEAKDAKDVNDAGSAAAEEEPAAEEPQLYAILEESAAEAAKVVEIDAEEIELPGGAAPASTSWTALPNAGDAGNTTGPDLIQSKEPWKAQNQSGGMVALAWAMIDSASGVTFTY